MRKVIAALLCMLLLTGACPALAGTYNGSLFRVQYDSSFALDQYSYLESGHGTWFFVLYNSRYSIDCGMEQVNRGVGQTLAGADAQTVAAYAQAVCQAAGGQLVETVMAGTQPFVIVSANRPGLGQVYYAETVLGGAAIYFEIYNLTTGSVGVNELNALKGVLNGFAAK